MDMQYRILYSAKFFINIGLLCMLALLSACTSVPMSPTHYMINSNPQGAKVYRGVSPDSMRFYQTTPYVDRTHSLKDWSGHYFQARKQGYNNSSVYRMPYLPAGGVVPISFMLQPKADELVAYKQRNSLSGYYEYLRKYPDSKQKQQVFGLMASLIALSSSPNTGYKRLVEQYPEASVALPEKIRLNYIGPKGMKVADLRSLLKQGIGSAILQQKILSAGQPYAEFSFAEIKRLTAMGFSDQLVASMLKVTQEHKVKQESKRQQKAAAVAVAQKQRTRTRAAPAAAAPQAPGVGDKLADCAIMLAKKKACDQIGGFGGMACMALLPGGHNCF